MAKSTKSTTSTSPVADQHDHAGHDHAGHDHSAHDHAPAATSTEPSLIAPNSKITVTLAWSAVEPIYKKVLNKLSQRVQTDGFRKGKVPSYLAEQLVEPSKIVEPVLQELLPDAYSKVLADEKKRPVSQPEFDPQSLNKGADWVIDIYFAEAPEIKLGKYQDVVKKALKAAEKEVAELNKDREETAQKVKDTPVADKAPEEAVTSASDAEVREIKLKAIFRELAISIKPSVPEILVRQEANHELEQLSNQLEQLKMSIDRYLDVRKMTGEQLQQEFAAVAISRLQLEFILAEISKEQKIAVEETEIDAKLNELTGGKLSKEELAQHQYRSYLFSSLLKEKVTNYLLSL